MKKLFLFCIGTMFAVCASVTYAMADDPADDAPGYQVERACDENNIHLVHGAKTRVSCADYGLGNARECYAYCNDSNMIFGIQTCYDGYFKLEQHSVGGLYKRCGDLQQACLSPDSFASGARWNDGKCDCGGYDKEWNRNTMRCELSENYKKCIQDSDAHWDDTLGVCFCNNSLEYQWDDTRYECVKLPDRAECESFQHNRQFQGDVQWNLVTRRCECKKDKNGTTITNPGDWRIGAFGCEKKPSVLRREEFAANMPAADAASRRINDIVDELKGISEDWGRSRWKNADGGFNTARLASDSIAGVVLGTVGGVITSNVIKKNQVKGGFEDINCTVGGQRVADYADQFRVGIK